MALTAAGAPPPPPDENDSLFYVHVADGYTLKPVDIGYEQPRLGPQRVSFQDIRTVVDAGGTLHVAYNFELLLQHAWLTDDGFLSETLNPYGHGFLKAWAYAKDMPLTLLAGNSSFSAPVLQFTQGADSSWESELLGGAEAGGVAGVWLGGQLHVAYLQAYPIEQEAGVVGANFYHIPVLDGLDAPFEGLGTLTTQRLRGAIALAADAEGLLHMAYVAPPDDYLKFAGVADDGQPQMVHYVTVNGAEGGNGAEGSAGAEWGTPEAVLTDLPADVWGLAVTIPPDGTVVVSGMVAGVRDEDTAVPTAGVSFRLFRRSGPNEDWVVENLPMPERFRVWGQSLAFDSESQAHVVYCEFDPDAADTNCRSLNYLHQVAGEWHNEVLLTGCRNLGDRAAIAFGPSGERHIVAMGCDEELVYLSVDE